MSNAQVYASLAGAAAADLAEIVGADALSEHERLHLGSRSLPQALSVPGTERGPFAGRGPRPRLGGRLRPASAWLSMLPAELLDRHYGVA